jgi:hypothetical protein
VANLAKAIGTLARQRRSLTPSLPALRVNSMPAAVSAATIAAGA